MIKKTVFFLHIFTCSRQSSIPFVSHLHCSINIRPNMSQETQNWSWLIKSIATKGKWSDKQYDIIVTMMISFADGAVFPWKERKIVHFISCLTQLFSSIECNSQHSFHTFFLLQLCMKYVDSYIFEAVFLKNPSKNFGYCYLWCNVLTDV